MPRPARSASFGVDTERDAGNSSKWYEATTHMYTRVASWGISGHFVNLAWWNRLDPAVREFVEKTFRDVEEAQWKLGAELTQDGIECNVSDAAACRIFTPLKKRKLAWVKATDADNARARQILTDVVPPNWVKRCGPHCGEAYNQAVAPISGVRYAPRQPNRPAGIAVDRRPGPIPRGERPCCAHA